MSLPEIGQNRLNEPKRRVQGPRKPSMPRQTPLDRIIGR